MSKLKIIAIDDQPENLQMIVQMLKDDYSVIASTSGNKALELANKHPDAAVILLDVFMPEISGFEVLTQLKACQATQHIPVIFVTGVNSEEDYNQGLEQGGYDFVLKPISPALLKNRIAHAVIPLGK
jgi:putative two-component system response regulator